MNDRCASGTGRFYEVLARAIECDIGELGALSLRSSRSWGDGTDLEVSSMCATFAETEIVSLLAQGLAVEDIAAPVTVVPAATERDGNLSRPQPWCWVRSMRLAWRGG